MNFDISIFDEATGVADASKSFYVLWRVSSSVEYVFGEGVLVQWSPDVGIDPSSGGFLSGVARAS
jgi:hypothetical protein